MDTALNNLELPAIKDDFPKSNRLDINNVHINVVSHIADHHITMPRTNTARHPFHQKGFTFLEIMLVVAIIGILIAIAVPLYSEYSKQAHLNNAAQRAAHLQMLLDDYWGDNGTYVSGNDAELQTPLGWHPGDNNIESIVTAGSTGSITTSYTITTTHNKVAGESVVITYAQ